MSPLCLTEDPGRGKEGGGGQEGGGGFNNSGKAAPRHGPSQGPVATLQDNVGPGVNLFRYSFLHCYCTCNARTSTATCRNTLLPA